MSDRETGCTVRKAVDDDLLDLLRIFSRHEEGLAPFVASPSKLQVLTFASMLSTPDMSVYLAEVEGQIAGSATFLRMPTLGYGCRPSGFIEAMVVDARFRRRGVARSIIESILDEARSNGCHKIQLLAHKRHAHDGAHDFYRSLGFEAEAEGFRMYLGSEVS